MNTLSLDHRRIRTALRTVKMLVSCHLGLSTLTLGAVIMLRNHPTLVTPAVWIRASILVAGAAFMTALASRLTFDPLWRPWSG